MARSETAKTSERSRARNLVLLLVDGLGAEFLERHSNRGFLRRHQLATLTTVCPSTVAAVIPTEMTGLAPAAHALTGWHVYVPEIDAVTAVLPLMRRGKPLPDHLDRESERLFGYGTFYQRIRRPSPVVSPVQLNDSHFSAFHARGASRHAYYPEACPQLTKMVYGRRRQDFSASSGACVTRPDRRVSPTLTGPTSIPWPTNTASPVATRDAAFIASNLMLRSSSIRIAAPIP